MTGQADNDMKVNEQVGKQLAELMGRRFAPSLRDVANTLADRKFTELISTANGGRIGRQLDQLAARIAEEKIQALVQGRAGPAETLVYPSLEEFCVDFLFPLYAANLHSTAIKWCPSWSVHIAATVRLEALWRSFEHNRLEGLPGVANWLVSIADPIMAKLMDPDGPFVFCDPIKGHEHNGEDQVADLPHTPLAEGTPYARRHPPEPASAPDPR
ncbi:DUF4913 domain-containing protein [Nocardia carnea]|uniref:DUF4913 domain-containing protein n=1 Tax=Nocardia carnea TaxID=37328 RepID=UPI000301AEC1|nr:DUF4913 domain-containing protein [Nocardia carnea]